jgi:diguanylate cyclase (GGDEF)-like protein/PAS domain S-box-containing protein
MVPFSPASPAVIATAQPLSESTALPAGGSDIDQWRARLLQTILRVGTVLGMLPLLLSVLRSLDTGVWCNPLAASSAICALALLSAAPSLPYRLRTWGLIGVLYALSAWLLAHSGISTQIYLLVCPALGALLLPWRTALAVLLTCSVTLVLVGWGTGAALTTPGHEHLPLMRWVSVGASFLVVGGMVTLSGSLLLDRIERALALQRQLADALRADKDMLRQVNAQIPGMVYRVRIDRHGKPTFLYASEGAKRLFGFDAQSVMADGHILSTRWHAEDRARLQAEMRRATETGEPVNVEYRLVMPDGTEKWVHASSTVIHHDEHGAVRNGIIMDITERKTSEALVWKQANFDALTGLPNRRMLRDRLEQAITRCRREHESVALMLIDLDHFKEVNDTLGHDGGDRLLVEAARRIRACVRESDTVARMGGDEFTVVLPGLGSPDRVDAIANAIIERLGEVFVLGRERAFVSASIGITLFPNDGEQLEALLKNADQALYAAKGAGRHGFRYFTGEMQAHAQVRARLALDLRHAIDAQHFCLHYQPIVDLRSGRITKAEALIRWHHAERGMISPALFIPIAESTGLIGDIGEWVFHTAALQVRQWRTRIDPQFQISVNRSPMQFRGGGTERRTWGDQLRALGLPGQAIAVEITEGVLLDATESVTAQLLALRNAGLSVSLDDFGTGYSSLSYLQKFDIDTLKIDRSFVNAIDHGATGRALCKAMIVMAHELDMKVIAEGVETQTQHDWLREAGCDYAQGYWLARPMPADALEALVAERVSACV